MKKKSIHITVLGAGISGLAAAYWLHGDGFEITVLEAKSAPGGTMETVRENDCLIDYGPNSGLETTPLIGRMVRELGLKQELIYANESGNRRYILKHNQLMALPMGPAAFLKTKLFSTKAKLRLLAEPFIGKSADGYYQSVSEFVRRRLGREFLDYAINPFVAGVFAGNPDSLSVQSAFPKLYRLETLYGGLIKGMIKGAKERKASGETSKQTARMFSFRSGMQTLPVAIAGKLGEAVRYGCDVREIVPFNHRFKVRYLENQHAMEMDTDIVLSAIPAYRAAAIFEPMDTTLSRHLNQIYYPPVKVLFLGFKKAAVKRELDGFGFLIPEKENKTFLGAIWTSTIFVGRAPEEVAAFTLFVGGARSPHLFDTDADTLFHTVLNEFKEIMNIEEAPLFVRERMWSKAIPQYTLGYIEHERYFERFETEHPGIFLSGNFRGGISVGDCVKNSESVYQRIVRKGSLISCQQ
ncbi:MAG: protoporphyrinogen oxidase [Desulfobacterales bacterium]|jgi:oxygen-dependent protoporphyrinogen oxidase|nr:protoporphyrinogen oxidase [Desulfobacterales bacterium]